MSISNPTIEDLAKLYNVSVERIKEQYAANAKGLQAMYEKALEKGKKVGGYTADQLKQMAADYLAKSL
jgi:hypothetical protein